MSKVFFFQRKWYKSIVLGDDMYIPAQGEIWLTSFKPCFKGANKLMLFHYVETMWHQGICSRGWYYRFLGGTVPYNSKTTRKILIKKNFQKEIRVEIIAMNIELYLRGNQKLPPRHTCCRVYVVYVRFILTNQLLHTQFCYLNWIPGNRELNVNQKP